MFDLIGRVSLVTGGGNGIGRAICLTLAEAGSDVVCADIDADRAAKTVSEVRAVGRRGFDVRANVTIEEVRRMVVSTIKEFGRLDVLVNNVGIGTGTGSLLSPDHSRIENLTVPEWESHERQSQGRLSV